MVEADRLIELARKHACVIRDQLATANEEEEVMISEQIGELSLAIDTLLHLRISQDLLEHAAASIDEPHDWDARSAP